MSEQMKCPKCGSMVETPRLWDDFLTSEGILKCANGTLGSNLQNSIEKDLDLEGNGVKATLYTLLSVRLIDKFYPRRDVGSNTTLHCKRRDLKRSSPTRIPV